MNTLHNVHADIAAKIKSGLLKQKPKWHFVLLTLLFVLGLSALSLVLIYLMSFLTLVFHERQIFEALSFGPQTFFQVVHGVPFVLVVLVGAVFIVVHLLVRHFAFAYTRPVMATFIGALAITFSMFAIVSSLDPERRVAHFGEGVPGVVFLHQEFRPQEKPEIIRGTIQDMESNEYFVEDALSHIFDIHTDTETRLHEDSYQKGDRIMAFVRPHGNILYALGIRKDDEFSK